MSQGVAALFVLSILFTGIGLTLVLLSRRIARSLQDIRGSAREPQLAVQVIGGVLVVAGVGCFIALFVL
jgi:hypothetical protein